MMVTGNHQDLPGYLNSIEDNGDFLEETRKEQRRVETGGLIRLDVTIESTKSTCKFLVCAVSQ